MDSNITRTRPVLKLNTKGGVFVDAFDGGNFAVSHGPFEDEKAANAYIDHRVNEGSADRAPEEDSAADEPAAEAATETQPATVEHNGFTVVPVLGEANRFHVKLDDTFVLAEGTDNPREFASVEEATKWIDEQHAAVSGQ